MGKKKKGNQNKNTPKPESKAETKTETKSEAKTETKTETKVETKSEAKPETKTETKSEAKPETKTEPKVETKAKAKPEAKPETKTEPKVETKAKAKPETRTETKSEAKPETKTEPKVETKSKAKPETKTETKSEAKEESKKVESGSQLGVPPAQKASEPQTFKFDFGAKPSESSNQQFKFDFSKGTSEEKKQKATQKKGGKRKMQQEEEEEEEEENEGPMFDTGVFQEPSLLRALQKQMNTLIGKSSGYLETLPPAIQDRIKALKSLQSTKTEIDKEFKKEIEELEKKYEAKFAPLYVKRFEIVNGKIEPSSEEIGERITELDSEGKEIKTAKEGADITGVPEFWLQALKHHPDFEEIITQRDEEALKYLIDIKYCDVTEGLGFTIEFHFKENPFFSETVLTKSYHLTETSTGDRLYDFAKGGPITWKPGKDLTVKKVTKNPPKRGGRGGRVGRGGKVGGGGKPIVVEEPCPSFFNFFDPEKLITLAEQSELDEYGGESILEADYEMGLDLKEKVIPNAVLWYTGEVPELEMEFDDEEEEEGEEEEEEDEDYVPNPNEKNPECKQQ